MAKSPKLTAARRNKLKSTTFALPAERKYPIDTIGRARNALARAAQFEDAATQAKIRRAVYKKYPSLKTNK